MLARLRKIQEEHEEGFTLIELLVVIIIIGILAAIAIPIFLSQRNKGYDAGVKSDLRNAATDEESYLTDYNAYTTDIGSCTSTSCTADANSLQTTEGFKYSSTSDYKTALAQLTIKVNADQDYCMAGQSSSGHWFFYDSKAGGLQSSTTSDPYTCSDTTLGTVG